MTETDWLACSDPGPMLDHLRVSKQNRSRGGRRKLRLFGCGCGRRVMRLMSERGRRWLELGEQYADELLDEEQRRQIGEQDIGSVDGQRTNHQADLAAWFTLETTVMIAAMASAQCAASAIWNEACHQGTDYLKVNDAELREQVHLLRDLFGNPFHPVTLDPSWLVWNGGTVVKLAEAIYEDRAFDRLPVLADALEEAGCDKTDILNHCRQPADHLRGCWVVDLLLGKK